MNQPLRRSVGPLLTTRLRDLTVQDPRRMVSELNLCHLAEVLWREGPGTVRGCTFTRMGSGISLNTGMGLVGGIPNDITIADNTDRAMLLMLAWIVTD